MRLLWKHFLQAKSETTKFFTVQTFLPCKSPLLGYCLGDSCRNFLMWINTWGTSYLVIQNQILSMEASGNSAVNCLFYWQAGTLKYVLMSRFIITTWYASSIFSLSLTQQSLAILQQVAITYHIIILLYVFKIYISAKHSFCWFSARWCLIWALKTGIYISLLKLFFIYFFTTWVTF